jgi:hypothetical protein
MNTVPLRWGKISLSVIAKVGVDSQQLETGVVESPESGIGSSTMAS